LEGSEESDGYVEGSRGGREGAQGQGAGGEDNEKVDSGRGGGTKGERNDGDPTLSGEGLSSTSEPDAPSV